MLLLPAQRCDCNHDNLAYIANLEMIRVPGKERFQYRKLRCDKCKGLGNMSEPILPSDFFVRLEYDQSKMSGFERFKLPYYQGYYVSGIIQFSKKANHFRTIKFFGMERTEIWDSDNITKYLTTDDRQRII